MSETCRRENRLIKIEDKLIKMKTSLGLHEYRMRKNEEVVKAYK